MRSLKASPEGLKKIKSARETRGLAIDHADWLEEASTFIPPVKNGKKVVTATVSIGTWKRFLQGTPVKPVYFKAFCQVLQLDWEEVVDTEDEVKSRKDKEKSSPIKRDWDAAPDVSTFYNRSIELTTLKQWLLDDKCRLVTILAMGGVGKTALAVKLAEEVSEKFDYIIWRNLREAPTVEKIIADVVKFLSQQREIDLPESLGDKITRLIDRLRASRCLLIFDNGESILQSGSSTGSYREGYSGYGELFRRIGESQHQSCLILTSREQFKEVRRLAGKTLPVRFWELAGLSGEAREILTSRDLHGSDSEIEELINHYHGNALALQIVPETINKLFHGNIAAFLESGTTIFDDIHDLLTQQFERLSESEKSLMYWLAINREAVSETELTDDVMDLSPRQIRESLDSLLGRCLIQSTYEGLTLQNVVMEYVSDRLITKIIYELESCDLYLLRTHALIKASAPDYIRENQKR
ncbi:hypothetical protein H6G04_35415, partial [Calothrix membranacea FACHB-236]|nr:hypothetical protein [Calothrix membranacea FACHB-236]